MNTTKTDTQDKAEGFTCNPPWLKDKISVEWSHQDRAARIDEAPYALFTRAVIPIEFAGESRWRVVGLFDDRAEAHKYAEWLRALDRAATEQKRNR